MILVEYIKPSYYESSGWRPIKIIMTVQLIY